jgi:hypothetical protein
MDGVRRTSVSSGEELCESSCSAQGEKINGGVGGEQGIE